MTPYIILGSVGYAMLTSPTAYELEKKADFAEHAVTEGKPMLQYMGSALDGVSLTFSFHSDFVDPQEAWDDLVDMLNASEAFPVSMGNGILMGWFVLERLMRSATVTEEDGTLTAIECRVTLKEWSDPDRIGTLEAEAKKVAGGIKIYGVTRRPKSLKAEIPFIVASAFASGQSLVSTAIASGRKLASVNARLADGLGPLSLAYRLIQKSKIVRQ